MDTRDDDLGFFTIHRTRHLRRHARDDNNITGSAEHQDPTDPHPKFPKLLLEAQNLRGGAVRDMHRPGMEDISSKRGF